MFGFLVDFVLSLVVVRDTPYLLLSFATDERA